MTLNEMVQQCVEYADIQDYTSSGDSTTINNKLTSALNYAYKKIVKEKFNLSFTEDVVLDGNGQFTLTSLSRTFFKIINVKKDGYPISSTMIVGNKIECPDQNPNDTVTVEYYYIPSDLADMGDIPELPEGAVDHKIPCYYATYIYLKIDNDNNAEFWLTLWNDGFESIQQNRGEVETIPDVCGVV